MFREIFNMEVFGTSNCCHEPIYTPDVDGIGLCSYCGEWAEFEPEEIEEECPNCGGLVQWDCTCILKKEEE